MKIIKTKPFDLEAIKNGAKWGVFELNVGRDDIFSTNSSSSEMNLFESIKTNRILAYPLSLRWNDIDYKLCIDSSFHVHYDSPKFKRDFIIKLIQEPKLASDLSEVKVGDNVWDFNYGHGIVKNISTDSHHPITVEFSLRKVMFTRNGRTTFTLLVNQTLFLTEIKFEIPEV